MSVKDQERDRSKEVYSVSHNVFTQSCKICKRSLSLLVPTHFFEYLSAPQLNLFDKDGTSTNWRSLFLAIVARFNGHRVHKSFCPSTTTQSALNPCRKTRLCRAPRYLAQISS